MGAGNRSAQHPGFAGWQRRALVKYLTGKPRDFLLVATPGAGKTTFALRIAAELLADRTVDTITIVVPTEHLKIQWAEAATGAGLALDPRFSNATGVTSSDYHGVVVTYAQVASHPTRHRVRTENRRTLVIFDEIHHGGDAKSWGEGIREAFDDATRRLALTGTPFRSDDSPIPFVDYAADGAGVLRSRADHTYGYTDALADGWCARWCSWPTPGRRAGVTAPGRSTPPAWASRSPPSTPPGRGAPRWIRPANGCRR